MGKRADCIKSAGTYFNSSGMERDIAGGRKEAEEVFRNEQQADHVSGQVVYANMLKWSHFRGMEVRTGYLD